MMKNERIREIISADPNILSRLSDRQGADMLCAHYILNKCWKDIAASYPYSVENVYVIRRKAVAELLQLSESEVNTNYGK